ncbi:ankyrin-1-like [Dendronephthya gigantea]|uniref:ankyrin-1-like n=1 Tax=Dendronephthya gigantea TaxID=151771 RepID=UPI00106B7070|nr:ankyrin-1-like [Dendronephthya gigantea]
MIKEGANAEGKDKEGRTVLHLAAEDGNEILVDLLLKNNADVKQVDSKRNSVLHSAVSGGNVAIAEKLIKAGASVEGINSEGQTVLHCAAKYGNEILVDLLLKNNADVKKIDSKGNSVLHSAVGGGNVAIAEKLIKAGASVEGINNEGQTVLHLAAKYGNEILADLLLKNNADVKQIDSKRNSILHSAVNGGNVAIAEKLIKAGLSVKAKNDKGQTVLHLAVQRDDERMLDFLLKYNVNVNNLDYRGKSALYFALKKSFETANHKLAFMLAKAGAKAPLIKEEKGRTLLHIAVWENKIDVLKILVKCGVFLSDCDDEGETSLHLAVSLGYADAARILVEAGADVNIRNKKNLTPLHLAVMLSQDEVIKLLLEHEANPTFEDHRGRTALRCAVNLHRKHDIIQRIEEGIERLSLKDKLATIGPSGGVIQLDEVTLEIPAGSLTEDTKITLAKKDPRDFIPNSLQRLRLPVARQRAVELLPRGLKFLKPAVLLIRSKWTVFNSKHFILHGSYNDNQQKMVWNVMTHDINSDEDKEVLIAKINGFSVVSDIFLTIRGMFARIQCHYNYSFVCRAYVLYRRQRSMAAIDIAVVLISEFVDVNDEEDIKQLKDHFDEGYLIGEKGSLTRVNTDRRLQICINFLGVESNQDSFKINQILLDSDGYVYAINNISGVALAGPVDGNVEIREEIEDVLLWKLTVREEETHVQSSETERIPEEGPVDGNVEIREEIEDVLLSKLNVREEETHVVYQTTKLTNAEISRISCRLGLEWDSLAGLLDIPYYERENIRFNYLDFFSKAEKVLLIFINSQFFDRHILEKCFNELKRQDLIDIMLPMENEIQTEAVETGSSETQDSENKQLDKTRLSSRESYRISRCIVEDWMRLAGLLDIATEDRIIIRSENKYNDVCSQAEKMLSIFNRSKDFSREKLACCLEEIGLLYLMEPILTGKWRSL